MSKSLWPLLLLTLTACAPKVSTEVVTQTLRAGDLEVSLSAPQWVTRQDFYPVKVTYTNRGEQTAEFFDPLDCSFLGVEGVDQKVSPNREVACSTKPAPVVKLAPNEVHSGVSQGVIAGLPKGRYRIASQDLQALGPSQQMGPNESKRAKFTPQPILFEIR